MPEARRKKKLDQSQTAFVFTDRTLGSIRDMNCPKDDHSLFWIAFVAILCA
jgi:hypothetical protein